MANSPPRGVVIAVLLVCLSFAACAPHYHPLEGEPGQRTVWDAGEHPPRAVILALHGFNDYRGAFGSFAAYAASRGYLVAAFDQQGFGASRNRGLWPGSEVLAQDLAHHVARLRETWPGVPLFLIGESMGGAVAVVAQDAEGLTVDGLILVSPAVWGGDEFNPFYRAVLEIAVRIAPGWTVTGQGLGVRASDNIDALIALGRDPMVIKATRLDAIAGLVDLMDQASQSAGEIDLPVLVLIGENDEVIPPEAMADFAGRLAPEICHAVVYADGWHLLLRDLQREVVWRDILAWSAGEPVGLGRPPCRAAD